jgi:tetratricopeptide (TPR) repeat protein
MLIKSVNLWRANKLFLLVLLFILNICSYATTNSNEIIPQPDNQQLKNCISSINRPRDNTYARLSQHVYGNIKEGEKITIVNDVWEVHKIKKGVNDHFGAIYLNQQKKQLVLAFRGTSTIKGAIEDIQGIIAKKLTELQEVAFDFTKEAIDLATEKKMHLSFTGHSLGGFLAELSVYHSHVLDCPFVNAVTFESPGSKSFFRNNLQSSIEAGKINIDELDVIGYVSYPNLINTWDHHVGTLYQLHPVLDNDVWYTKDAHAMDKLVKALEKHKVNRTLMLDWPHGDQYKSFVKKSKTLLGVYKIDVELWRQKDNQFEQFYKTHYKFHETLGSPTHLPLVHFPKPISELLQQIEQCRNEITIKHWKMLKLPSDIVNLLTHYDIDTSSNLAILNTNSAKTSAELFREKLTCWYSNNVELAGKIHTGIVGLDTEGEGMDPLAQSPNDPTKSDIAKTSILDIPEKMLELKKEEWDITYVLKYNLYLALLEKEILPYLRQNKLKTPTCFINYAWGNSEHEIWVKKFSDHLEKAGLKVYSVVLENKLTLKKFLEKIETADYAIVIGTKLYLEKSDKEREKFDESEQSSKSETQLIDHYFIGYNSSQNDKIIPVLLEGTPEESLPFMFSCRTTYDFTKNDYFKELLNLVRDLHGIDKGDKNFLNFFGIFKHYSAEIDSSTTEEERQKYREDVKEKISKHDQQVRSNVNKAKEKILNDAISFLTSKEKLLNKSINFLCSDMVDNFRKHNHFQRLLKVISNLHNIENHYKIFINSFKKFKNHSLATNRITMESTQQQYYASAKSKDLEHKEQMRFDVNTIKKALLKELSKDSALDNETPNYSDKKELEQLNHQKKLEIEDINLKKKILLKELLASPITWNIPKQNHLFVGNEQLLNELQIKLHPSKESASAKTLPIIIFSGMGGVGKTQLALQYAHHTKYPYTLKAWFQAENIEQLKYQYIKFAKTLGYAEKKPSIKTALPFIKKWLLKNPGWLLVYDNVSNYEEIKEFLPENSGSIILTTRQQKWPGAFNMLNINVMTEVESIALVQSLIIRKVTESEKESIKELVGTLGYLPLALAQASAYIRQNQITVTDYLNLYKNHEQKLLADTALLEETHSLPVAVAWNISLETIVKEARERNQSILAMDLLNACAYMSAAEIPRDLLLAWLKEGYPNLANPELVLAKLINQLWKYSMISMDNNGNITVHRLVQAAMRHRQQQALEKENSDYPLLTLEWYNKLLKVVNREFHRKTKILEDERRQRNLLPHLQTLFSYYQNIWPNESKFVLVPIINNIGTALFLMGEVKFAKSYYESSLLTLELHYGKEHVDLVYTLEQLNKVHRYLGDAKQAKELHERVLKIKEQYYDRDHVEIANTLDQLGEDYRYLGDAKQAKELHERVLKIKEQYYDRDHVEIANTLDQLGEDYRYLGDAKQAKELHERALKIKEQYYGKDHVEMTNILDQLGEDYRYLGDAKQAKELHERALKIKEQYYGKDHVEIANILDQLGEDYRCLGDAKQAKELHERALKIKEQYYGYGKDHTNVTTLDKLGRDYRYLGNVKEAKETLERSLRIKEQYYGIGHVKLVNTLDELGRDYRYLGNVKEAKETLERSLRIKEQYYGIGHVEIADTLVQLGTIYVALNYLEKGKACLEQALITKESYYGMVHPEVAKTLIELGNAYKSLRDFKQAQRYLKRALKIREQCFGSNHPLTLDVKQTIAQL